MTDLVSIIITTYNRSDFLEETLNSIQNQTYSTLEILLIDDGSEESVAIINNSICNKFPKCKYFYKENSGQPDSRNYGIAKAKGAFIGFCDDDDYWNLNKLEKQINIFEKFPDYSLVTGCIEYVEENGQKTGIVKCHEGHNHGYIFKSLLVKNRTASITPLLKREVFDKVGYFNPNFTIAEDWEFWRRVSYYYKFYNINEIISYVRLHPKNMTNSRSGNLVDRFVLYRKLTEYLLIWGENRFEKKDIDLIFKVEWSTYKKMLINYCPSILNKVRFFIKVVINNLMDGLHLIYLIIKYEFLKSKNISKMK